MAPRYTIPERIDDATIGEHLDFVECCVCTGYGGCIYKVPYLYKNQRRPLCGLRLKKLDEKLNSKEVMKNEL